MRSYWPEFRSLRLAALAAIPAFWLGFAPAAGQEPAEPPGATAATPDLEAAAASAAAAKAAADRERFLPKLDIFFPEGDLNLRISRLANKTFFEGQVKYNFINGDITAFLRYRYYGYRRITQFAVFDSIEFENFERGAEEFDRVRGVLSLLQWPHSSHHRTYFLTEADRISSSRTALRYNTNRTNTFFRVGYQLGTGQDARSNAIVGEFRARNERLFTATREIGPGQTGFTAALTYSSDLLGDFDYVKAELETLKRFDLTPNSFVIGRLHAGLFPHRPRIDRPESTDPTDRYAIPRAEFFRLEGRDNLRGLGERTRGTHEAHTTFEWFVPWFRDQNREAFRVDWQTWYWIVYVGGGAAGYDTQVFRRLDGWIADAGLGFEAAAKLKNYRFFLSGIVARAFRNGENGELRLSIKSYH